MYLATTADTAQWNLEDDLLLLGPWCLREDRRAQWQPLRYTVMPSPWEDPRAIEAAEAYCREVISAMIPRLAVRLNRLHGTSWSPRYWRLLLEPWLLRYVHVLYDRYRSLQEALRRAPGLTTTVLHPSGYRPTCDLLDFATSANRESADAFNLQLYSQVVQGLGLTSAIWKTVGSQGWASVARPEDRVTRRIVRWLTPTAVRMLRPHLMIGDVMLTRRQLWCLLWAMAGRGRAWPAPPAVRCPAQEWNAAMRRELESLPAWDPFTTVLVKTLPVNFPLCFLEGYGTLRAIVRNQWPHVPAGVMSFGNWIGNEAFQLLAAEFGERGARIIGGQHGGGYGTYRVQPFERYEVSVVDRWFSFGWRDETSGRPITPLRRPHFACRPARNGAYRRRGGALVFVTTSHPRYPFRFDSSPVGQFTSLLEWRDRFLQRLTPSACAQLIVRLPTVDYGWGNRARLEASHAALRVSAPGDEPLKALVKRAKLVVVEYPGTVALEVLAANLPTILFWDPIRWPMREDAEPQFAWLREAGILWDSPEAAAVHLEAVRDDPWAWWERPAVQEARSRFVERHALGGTDWLPHWVHALAAELDASRTSSRKAVGVTLWFTGLPCSGKTTIAELVKRQLETQGHAVEWLDGDEVRRDFSAGVGFSRQDRTSHLQRVAYLCHLLTKHGVVVLASFVSPYRENRAYARQLIGEQFIEIFVDTPVDECVRRDVKGMYRKALAGEIAHFTGVSDPYEPPVHPELTVHTLEESPEQCARRVLTAIRPRLS